MKEYLFTVRIPSNIGQFVMVRETKQLFCSLQMPMTFVNVTTFSLALISIYPSFLVIEIVCDCLPFTQSYVFM